MSVHRSSVRRRACAYLLLASMLAPLLADASEAPPAPRLREVLRTTSTWAGGPIDFPQQPKEIVGVVVEIPPGAETGWHSHTAPSFAFVLSGVLEVQLRDGRIKRAQAGQAFAEVIDVAHNGRNVGDGPVKLIVFYTTQLGAPLTRRE